jgi:UDP-N-acetylmuramoyl-tripeptide--D-alanyl-D-alanine ligase
VTVLWTSGAIATATGGRASADFAVTGVTFDSREVGPGDLFVALAGAATDGHRFVDQALAAGAAGALVSTPVAGPHVLVADTAAALDALASARRAQSSARIVGITGSVGKTGTREALLRSLDRGAPGRVHASVKSYNNHVGVPLSLARMPADADFGIFEMGMSAAGELAALTRLVRPHLALVTWIAPAHSAFFSGEEAIADAKGEIFQGLEPGGTALIPYDSAHRDRLTGHARDHASAILTFGRGPGADYRLIEEVRAEDGVGRVVTAGLPGGRTITFTIGMAGAHWVNNALGIIAAVDVLDADLGLAGLALGAMTGLAGRGERHQVAVPGGGSALLIDESYNANPASMAAALAVLGETQVSGRKIALLGAMKELGAQSDALHAGLAAPLKASGASHALLVGGEMASLAEALGQSMAVQQCRDAAEAGQALAALVAPGDAILVKGSNSVGLVRVVALLGRGDS